MEFTNVTGWYRDDDAFDPMARVRSFRVNGRKFTAHSLQGEPEQWPMVIREGGRTIGTALHWGDVERVVSRIKSL